VEKHPYARLTVEGEKKTKWLCGCFQTVDGFFKFCSEHDKSLEKAIKAQIDELDMTIAIND
jgi:hypothetical protein